MKLTWARVIARRVDRHGLVQPVAPGKLAGVAGVVGGIHAQVMSAAEISLALRVRDATAADVGSALVADHTIIKTFGVRGTVHLLPASELGCWAAALSALPARSPFSAETAISAKERDAIVAAVGEALEHEDLTLEELGAAVVDRVGGWAGEKVMPAFQTMWPRWRQAISVAGSAVRSATGRRRRRRRPTPRRPDWEPTSRLRPVTRSPGSSSAICTRSAPRRPSTSRGGSPSTRGGPRTSSGIVRRSSPRWTSTAPPPGSPRTTPTSLKPLSARRTRALEQEVERLGEIAGRAPTLTIGPISVGPHA